MISDEELKDLKYHLVALIDSITKEEFVKYNELHGVHEFVDDGFLENIPDETMTIIITLRKKNESLRRGL